MRISTCCAICSRLSFPPLNYMAPLLNKRFPGSSAGKESACIAGRPLFNSLVRKICWRRARLPTPVFLDFPGDSDSKESACNVEDLGLIPELGRSPGEYSGLENPMDRGAWQATVHRITESDITERLSLSLLNHLLST